MANYTEVFKSKLDWAMPFQRTGDFPLDRTDLFSSYADAVKYAAGNTADPDSRALCGTSYVGQIITVFENDTVTVYKINADRTLGEVGKATLGDNTTIDLVDGTLSLHNFGKQYYKWIDASGEEGQEGYVAGHHELQIVDATHPWVSGLEPKVVSKTGGGFELAWYEPSPTTVEGLNSAVNTVRSDVEIAKTDIVDLQGQVGNDGSDGQPKTGLYKQVNDVKENLGDSTTQNLDTAWGQINQNKDDITNIQQQVDDLQGAQKNVQSDWNQKDATQDDYIKNKPTTIAGYGITDAKIENGTITLGENTIKPVIATEGKQLSTEDFSTELKTKLEGIETGAQKNVQSDWSAKAGDALILNKPTKLSQFTDDITEGVLNQVAQDLTEYYKKTETYSKEEVNNLLAPIHSMGISVVTQLPTENIDTYTIYLVKKGDAEGDVYNEYLYVNNKWELLGSTAVSLNGYVKTEDLAPVATTGSYTDLQNKPMVVTKTTQTLATNNITVDVAYTGSVVNTFAKDATTGEQIMLDVEVGVDKVTFSIAQVYANNIICDVFALA